jgi:Domain of unknown function (DUF4189)
MRRYLAFALIALSAFCASDRLARADGAVALGVPADVAKQGLATGYSYNAATTESARTTALEYCLKAQAPAGARALCKLVTTFHEQCVAVALDPAPGTPGWGWAVANTKSAAEATAVANCRKIAGPGRASACKVSNADCDGTAK